MYRIVTPLITVARLECGCLHASSIGLHSHMDFHVHMYTIYDVYGVIIANSPMTSTTDNYTYLGDTNTPSADQLRPYSEPWWRAVDQTPEWQLRNYPYKICLPFVLLMGGFGNVAAIVVLHRTKDHNSAQHVFLIALAVVDL